MDTKTHVCTLQVFAEKQHVSKAGGKFLTKAEVIHKKDTRFAINDNYIKCNCSVNFTTSN